MDDRLRHTDEQRAAAREAIDAIRSQLGRPHTVAHQGRQHPPPEPERETLEFPHLQAEMAWAVERERLEARVAELDTEVDRLRHALAAILHHAADAVTSRPDAPPPAT